MKDKILYYLVVLLFASLAWTAKAQDRPVPMNTLPEGFHRAYVDGKDTVAIVNLRDIYIFPQVRFRNRREEQRYWKLVRDVKKTLPYAKLVYNTLIETYEYIETMPDEKSKHEHLKRMEKELFRAYKPILKKLTVSQGKLLIRLIDRECNQTSFELAKAFLGGFRANFWNIFAGMFGASLKSEYDPMGKDKLTERIVVLVENGML